MPKGMGYQSCPDTNLFLKHALPPHPRSVDYKNVNMHIVTGRGSEKDSRTSQVFGVSPTAGRNTFQNLPVACFVLLQSLGVVGTHVTGRDRVDIDALCRPLIGQCLGKLRYSTLGGSVRGHRDASLKCQQGRDIDDLSRLFSLDKSSSSELAQLEYAVQVDLQHRHPVIITVVHRRSAANGSRIVDKNVDGSERLCLVEQLFRA